MSQGLLTEEQKMAGGIIEIDVHGMRTGEAYEAVRLRVASAGQEVYRVRVIHGHNGGTRIRSMLYEEFGYGREPKVKRIEMGNNPGITELILREL